MNFGSRRNHHSMKIWRFLWLLICSFACFCLEPSFRPKHLADGFTVCPEFSCKSFSPQLQSRIFFAHEMISHNSWNLSAETSDESITLALVDRGPDTAHEPRERGLVSQERQVLFGTMPPVKDVARLLLKRTGMRKKHEDTGDSLPLSSQPVSAVGRLVSVQHLAKSLCLCEFVPATVCTLAEDDAPSNSLSWICEKNQRLTIQLVVVGDVALSIDKLENKIVLVRGVTVVDNKHSLKNWVHNSQLDVKVSSIQCADDTIWSSLSVDRYNEGGSASLFRTSEPKHESLRFLRLSDLYQSSSNQPVVTVVESLETIHTFARSLSLLNASALSSRNSSSYVGIDCEWKPDTISLPEDPQPILLLQVSLHELQQVYLLDLQTMLRPLQSPNTSLNELEAAVSDVIASLWRSERLLKVGFQLVGDLRRLAASYPHMRCFGEVCGVLEVSRVARKVMRVVTKQRNAKFVTSSLARLVQHFLQLSIDKAQQCSDWSSRPLSPAQLEYAATDAAIAPVILDWYLMPHHHGVHIHCEPSLHIGRWIGDTSFAGCIASWEFLANITAPDSKLYEGASLFKAKRRQSKGYQRLFGNLPPVVTHRWLPGAH